VAKLRYRPGGRRPVTLEDASAALAGFLSLPLGPLVTVVGGILGSLFKPNAPFAGVELVADSETGQVTGPTKGLGVTGSGGARGITVYSPKQHQHELALLQKTFDSGIIQSGIAPYYRAYAEALARFRAALDAEDRTGIPPDVRTPTVPGDRGESPPGEPEPPEEPLPPEEFEPPAELEPDFDPLQQPKSLSPPHEFPWETTQRIQSMASVFRRAIPGGSAGFAQQTNAGKLAMMGRTARAPRRRKRRASAKRVTKSTRRGSKRRTNFNSKAWMDKIRKMRGKKAKK
jgi:hypothetical protein